MDEEGLRHAHPLPAIYRSKSSYSCNWRVSCGMGRRAVQKLEMVGWSTRKLDMFAYDFHAESESERESERESKGIPAEQLKRKKKKKHANDEA